MHVVYTVNKVVYSKQPPIQLPMAYKTESETSCEYIKNSRGNPEQAHTSGTALCMCMCMFACLLICLLELTTLLHCKFQMSTFKHFAKTDCPCPEEIGHGVTLNVQVHAICENLDPKNLPLYGI